MASRRFAKLLASLPEAVAREVGSHMFACGELVRVEAQISLTTGAVSGKNHVPSRPGEPPNQDTAVLGNNIETTQPERLRVLVTSHAGYSAALEYGTSKMAARPFMGPALAKHRSGINKKLQGAAKHAVRRHFKGA